MKQARFARRRALATSFVVTVAAAPAAVGCKKTPFGGGDGERSVYVSRQGDRCTMDVPMSCPKNASCNPPPPQEIDCPPDDGGAAAGVTRRPPGKEDWLRVKPHVWLGSGNCGWVGETFCAPPGKPYSCTGQNERGDVKCTRPDGGPWKLEAFVWKDSLGGCHEVDPMVASSNVELPEGRPVKCP